MSKHLCQSILSKFKTMFYSHRIPLFFSVLLDATLVHGTTTTLHVTDTYSSSYFSEDGIAKIMGEDQLQEGEVAGVDAELDDQDGDDLRMFYDGDAEIIDTLGSSTTSTTANVNVNQPAEKGNTVDSVTETDGGGVLQKHSCSHVISGHKIAG